MKRILFFIALPFLGLMWMLKNIGFATAATLREDIPAMLEFSLWVIDGVLVWITGPPEWATLTALAICAIAYVLSLLNSQHAKHSVLGLLQKERREFEYRQIMSDDFVRQMKRSAMAKKVLDETDWSPIKYPQRVDSYIAASHRLQEITDKLPGGPVFFREDVYRQIQRTGEVAQDRAAALGLNYKSDAAKLKAFEAEVAVTNKMLSLLKRSLENERDAWSSKIDGQTKRQLLEDFEEVILS